MNVPEHPVIEAILLMATEPIAAAEIADALDEPAAAVEQALAELATFYDHSGRGFALRHSGGGWRLTTRAEHADILGAWALSGQHVKLSKAALETLAIVAYLQPVTRARISAVRGVKVDAVMRTLELRGLVTTVESDELGHAYATTDHFLDRLGLDSLDELPPLAPHLPDAMDLESELARLDPSGPRLAAESGTLDTEDSDGEDLGDE